ncbi:MAG: DUF1294 domain-containing protein [Butyrivibrio sp.]|nr:DUF1294 domain-containing protein [Butyrivibrio sp.]
MDSFILIISYFIIINIIGFALMGIDKRKAKRHAFRIPEATLFSVALIGGSLGSIIGMFLFRHKTRHWYFLFGLPAIFVLHIIILAILILLPVSYSFI